MIRYRAATVALLIPVLAPGLAAARTVIGVSAASTRSGGLGSELEQKLIHTDRYTVVPITDFSVPAPVCPELPHPEFVLSVSLEPSAKAGKLAGRVRIYDCLRKTWLAGSAEGSSAKSSTLASNLKDDLLELLPFTEKLELNGSVPCVAGGKAVLIRPGKRLWWYGESGQPLGRWIVTEEAPADGCARLVPDYRLHNDATPQMGQILSDRPPAVRKPRAYTVPLLGMTVQEASTAARPMDADQLPPGWHHIGTLPIDQSAWIAEAAIRESGPKEFAVYWNTVTGRSRPPSLKTGYVFTLGRSGWKLSLHGGKGKPVSIASGKIPHLVGSSNGASVRIVHEGRWSELYVDDRFVTGLDDETLYGGDLFVTAVPAKPPDAPVTGTVFAARIGNVAQPLD